MLVYKQLYWIVESLDLKGGTDMISRPFVKLVITDINNRPHEYENGYTLFNPEKGYLCVGDNEELHSPTIYALRNVLYFEIIEPDFIH